MSRPLFTKGEREKAARFYAEIIREHFGVECEEPYSSPIDPKEIFVGGVETHSIHVNTK